MSIAAKFRIHNENLTIVYYIIIFLPKSPAPDDISIYISIEIGAIHAAPNNTKPNDLNGLEKV